MCIQVIRTQSKRATATSQRRNWTAEFPAAEVLAAVFRTDSGVLGKTLPRPLRPSANPLALAFVAHYLQTNFGTVYNEAALFAQAEYRGRLGTYCLSMPVDDGGLSIPFSGELQYYSIKKY